MNSTKGICIITLSDNFDHQEVAFSMFNVLYPNYNVYNIGLINQKNPRSPHSAHSFYFNAPRRPGINKQTFNVFELMKIVKKINSLDVEYVYFESEHMWNALIMLLINKKFKKVEVIHDVIPHSDSKGKNLANKVTCRLADYVLIRNEKYKDELIKRYKVLPQNVIVMPLWRYYPELNIDKNQDYFLFFGRIRKYKGIDNMLLIAQKCPNIKFCVVGSPDLESTPVVELLKKMKNVTVIDKEVDDAEMENYFRSSKAIILPYSSATQSGVIVDAYKYSKPVIAFNVGAISEQVIDNVSGYLVQKDDISEFIEKIVTFSKLSQKDVEKFQKSAYEFGYKKYSAQENSTNFIKYFLN